MENHYKIAPLAKEGTETTMHRVLIVSDNNALVSNLNEALESGGFEVVAARHALEAMKRVYDTHPSVLITEDRLSVSDSLDLCSHVSDLSCIAIILLGNGGSERQVMNGLNRGADFYIPQPVSTGELLARVNTLLRRRQGWPENVRSFLDAGTLTVRMGPPAAEWVKLTVTEFRLLSYLALNSGRVIPTKELLAQVWPGNEVRPSSLSFYIYKLRQKLEPEAPASILTHYGVGYRICLDLDPNGNGMTLEGHYPAGTSN